MKSKAMKPIKDAYKQDKYEPIVKKTSKKMTLPKAVKLRSDRKRGYE